MQTPGEGTDKNQLEPGQDNMGDLSELLHCSFLGNFDQNRPVCWSIIVKEKTVVLHFSVFFSDHFPKATKYVNVYFFIQILRDELIIDNNLAVKYSCKLCQRMWGTF
jgi:hypothetical protein